MYELRNARTGSRIARVRSASELKNEMDVIKAIEGLERKYIDVVYIDGYECAQDEMLEMVRKLVEERVDPKKAIVQIRSGCDMLSISWWLDTIQRLTLTVDALDQYIRRRIAP